MYSSGADLCPSEYLTIRRQTLIYHLRSKRFIGIFNALKPTGHVMNQQINIQQLYAVPTLYLCVLYLSENKQRLVPLTA